MNKESSKLNAIKDQRPYKPLQKVHANTAEYTLSAASGTNI